MNEQITSRDDIWRNENWEPTGLVCLSYTTHASVEYHVDAYVEDLDHAKNFAQVVFDGLDATFVDCEFVPAHAARWVVVALDGEQHGYWSWPHGEAVDWRVQREGYDPEEVIATNRAAFAGWLTGSGFL